MTATQAEAEIRRQSEQPVFFTLPENFDPQLPARYRDADDEARHFVDTVVRKMACRDFDESGFVHLHHAILNKTIRNRTRAPIIRALRQNRCIESTPHREGKYSRGYRLTDEMLTQEPCRRACRDLVLLNRIRCERSILAAEQHARWLPIHRSLAKLQRCLTVTDTADQILDALEPEARFCQRILLNSIRSGYHTFTVGYWGRCFNSLTGIKRELRATMRIEDEPIAGLDIRCAQPALLALLIGAANPTLRLFSRTPCTSPVVPGLVVPSSPPVSSSEFGRFRELVCGGDFNEWLAAETGLPRDQVKRRFLIDVLAKLGTYSSAVEFKFQDHFPGVHDFLRNARLIDYRTIIRALQRLESWLVIENVAPRLVGEVPFVTLHDAIYCRGCDLSRVNDAFEETFDDIGFRVALKAA